ncbi:7984_t:CDS:2, partial [Racocetra persica]
ELVVVAIKARNLSARDVIGKGDPFTTFRIGDMAKRTKTDKRGGQHPVWDEEIRFQLMDEPRHKVMKIQIYNEDKREHILVGDEVIKLDEVLKTGEWDAWHEIKYRNKYAGEIYLEMTFYNA